MTVRAAVIDVGSNSVRLLVIERGGGPRWRVLREERSMVRLGRGLAPGARLDPVAADAAIAAIVQYEADAKKERADFGAVYATASVRDAADGDAFVARLRRLISFEVRVLSAEEEGVFTFRGASATIDLHEGHSAVCDLGGGSLEVVRAVRGLIVSNESVQLGSLRLVERFGGPAAAAGKRFPAMDRYVRGALARGVSAPQAPIDVMVGAGGGFAASLAMAAARKPTKEVTLAEVARQLERLRAMTPEARTRVPGLEPRRADIIVPGLCVIHALMQRLEAKRFIVHGSGVRDGMALDLLERHGAAGSQETGIAGAAYELAVKCPEALRHMEHVRDLSLELLDSLESHRLLGRGKASTGDARGLLEAGALLHDIGVVVDYKDHHRFSEIIAMRAHLPGWTPRQRRIVALLARHHRKGEVVLGKGGAAELKAADAKLLFRLSAILRAADALDRGHGGDVQRVHVERAADGVWEIVIRADGDLQRELRALWKKGKPLRSLLGGRVRTRVIR
ncbi:MAG: Ppx/GppA phosphatase family protein [Phycisphaerales bacterium]